MADTPLFAVSQFTTWNLGFEQDVALYARLGVRGIEVCQRKLDRDPRKAADQLRLLRDAGLTVTSVQPRVHALFRDFMCPDLEDPQRRLEHYRATIDLFAGVFPGQDLPLVTITGAAPGLNYEQAHATARRLYPPLADYAADRGLRIMFEPLSPVLMNIDTFIDNLTEAVRLVEDVDRPNFGLMIDLWHVWREPMIAARLRRLSGRVFGVHISDWPVGEPRCPGDRRICGTGAIDLPLLLGALDAAGYRGAYCLEIFSDEKLPDSLWRMDPAEMIQKNREGFFRGWKEKRCD